MQTGRPSGGAQGKQAPPLQHLTSCGLLNQTELLSQTDRVGTQSVLQTGKRLALPGPFANGLLGLFLGWPRRRILARRRLLALLQLLLLLGVLLLQLLRLLLVLLLQLLPSRIIRPLLRQSLMVLLLFLLEFLAFPVLLR